MCFASLYCGRVKLARVECSMQCLAQWNDVSLLLINVFKQNISNSDLCVHNICFESSSVHCNFLLFFLSASLGFGFFFATLLGKAKPQRVLFTVYDEIICRDYLIELPVKADAFIPQNRHFRVFILLLSCAPGPPAPLSLLVIV